MLKSISSFTLMILTAVTFEAKAASPYILSMKCLGTNGVVIEATSDGFHPVVVAKWGYAHSEFISTLRSEENSGAAVLELKSASVDYSARLNVDLLSKENQVVTGTLYRHGGISFPTVPVTMVRCELLLK